MWSENSLFEEKQFEKWNDFGFHVVAILANFVWAFHFTRISKTIPRRSSEYVMQKHKLTNRNVCAIIVWMVQNAIFAVPTHNNRFHFFVLSFCQWSWQSIMYHMRSCNMSTPPYLLQHRWCRVERKVYRRWWCRHENSESVKTRTKNVCRCRSDDSHTHLLILVFRAKSCAVSQVNRNYYIEVNILFIDQNKHIGNRM